MDDEERIAKRIAEPVSEYQHHDHMEPTRNGGPDVPRQVGSGAMNPVPTKHVSSGGVRFVPLGLSAGEPYTKTKSEKFKRGLSMHVGEYMTRDPVTVSEDTSMKEAMLLLRTHHIRHLPVANGKLLIGLVSDRDIRRASPSLLSGIDKSAYERVLEDTPVARIMTREPFTVTESTPLADAVSALVEKKFGSLLVVDGRELVGIFTEIDALKILLSQLQ